jgi:hypothetical protein
VDHLPAPPGDQKAHGRRLAAAAVAVDQQDLTQITSPDFPGERLIACRNPFEAAKRARTREYLLAATEADLGKIAAQVATGRVPPTGSTSSAPSRPTPWTPHAPWPQPARRQARRPDTHPAPRG